MLPFLLYLSTLDLVIKTRISYWTHSLVSLTSRCFKCLSGGISEQSGDRLVKLDWFFLILVKKISAFHFCHIEHVLHMTRSNLGFLGRCTSRVKHSKWLSSIPYTIFLWHACYIILWLAAVSKIAINIKE